MKSKSEYQLGRVAAVDKDSFLVSGESGEVYAEIAGKLRFAAKSGLDLPTVGDWVDVQYLNEATFAIIIEILPRKSLLKRKAAGKKIDYQLLAANIDTAFVMQSLDSDFNPRRLERYLVAVNEGGIRPVVLLSKADLSTSRAIEEKIAALRRFNNDLKIVPFSSTTGVGLAEIRALIVPGSTYCLLGSSGVGKTTLLNKLLGQDIYKTAEVRISDSHGRHTTSRRQLIAFASDAFIIDTPGMRELGNIDIETGLEETFEEIAELFRKCRYSDCTHTKEPGCAILASLKEGTLSEERLRSYQKLRKEAAYNKLSYAEKRKKDKAFGKFLKNTLKEHKKYQNND